MFGTLSQHSTSWHTLKLELKPLMYTPTLVTESTTCLLCGSLLHNSKKIIFDYYYTTIMPISMLLAQYNNYNPKDI